MRGLASPHPILLPFSAETEAVLAAVLGSTCARLVLLVSRLAVCSLWLSAGPGQLGLDQKNNYLLGWFYW